MINVYDIMILLGVTEQQVAVAIYSGRIPKPNDEGGWYRQSIQMYLDLWEQSLNKKRKDVSRNIVTSSGMEFPKHSR
jgi:hypothetical protein